MKKRGQAQVVTTILMILIVLAAVIIVWQVIDRFVRSGGEAIETRVSCIDIKLEIAEADSSAGTVKITRMAGGEDDPLPAVKNVKILVEKSAVVTTGGGSLTQFETKTWTVTGGFSAGDLVEAGVVLQDDTICDPIASARAI